MDKLLSEDAVSRIKAFAENEALEWVDVHGDIWDLLKAYSDTMRENERLREALMPFAKAICEDLSNKD